VNDIVGTLHQELYRRSRGLCPQYLRLHLLSCTPGDYFNRNVAVGDDGLIKLPTRCDTDTVFGVKWYKLLPRNTFMFAPPISISIHHVSHVNVNKQ
jgi:hypothetical protein